MAGKPAGLLYVSSEQINLQIPADVPNPGPAPVQVWVGDRHSDPVMCDFGRSEDAAEPAGAGLRGHAGLDRLAAGIPVRHTLSVLAGPLGFRRRIRVETQRRDRSALEAGADYRGYQRGLTGMFGGVPGAPTGRLPLHLALSIHGARQILGPLHWIPGTQPAPGGMRREQVDESDWFDFEVRAVRCRRS